MKIVQLVSNLNYGDAIGNDILAIHDALTRAGHAAEIMALSVHERLIDRGGDVDFSRIAPEDLVIFHKASGDALSQPFIGLRCRKALLYHNITPGRWFFPYDEVVAWNQWRGRRQLRALARRVDWAWGDSEYNCQELARMGFDRDRIAVLPILYRDEGAAESGPRAPRADAGTRLTFIGRVAPNKKQEDVIKVFYCYVRDVDPEARLFLVGSWDGNEKYYAKLKGFAADLGLTDDQVVFAGHVTDAEKEEYLARADVFVCMSAHEGFCVPLLEAMYRDIPVAACSSTAVTETLGDNGLLYTSRDYAEIARGIGRLRADAAFRRQVLQRQRENLRRFDFERTEARLLALVDQALGNGGAAQ